MFCTKKKAGICLLFLLFMIPAVLAGCRQEKKESHVFYARILEIRERTMLVRPEEAGSADTFVVDMTGMDLSPEPAVGDYVEFTYEGGITETYPAGLGHEVSIASTDVNSIPEKGPVRKKTGRPPNWGKAEGKKYLWQDPLRRFPWRSRKAGRQRLSEKAFPMDCMD